MPTSRKKLTAVLAAFAALSIPLTACSPAASQLAKEAAHERPLAAAGDACAHVNAPMLDVPTSDTEPRMRIPQPDGWEPLADLGDMRITRFALANNPSRVAGVSLFRRPITDAQTLFDGGRAEVVDLFAKRGWPTELTTTPGTVCGLPAETILYSGAPALGADPITVLFVAANACGDSYLAMVVLDFDPDNPSYQRDAETILTGLQVLPPATSL
jgi:hypothetical protein